MNISKPIDLTIIGSGPGGYHAAIRARLRGLKVAIVEGATWGGTCLNRGCVPKKAWYETAKLMEESTRIHHRGIIADMSGVDIPKAWEHQRDVVNTVRTSFTSYLQRLGVEMFSGLGSFVDENHVLVRTAEGPVTIKTRHSIIATGSTPGWPASAHPVAGKVLTTDMMFDDGVPEGGEVLLVGGGVVGTELAYILTMLGKKVRWVINSHCLDKSFYSNKAKNDLRAALGRLGILPFRMGFKLEQLDTGGDGVTAIGKNGEELHADWLLLATGRKPYTEKLGLENTAVITDDNGFIRINAHLQTEAPSIYAIGDVIGPFMTANQAIADANLAVDNIVSGNTKYRDPMWVPEVMYSALELARIGMSDEQADDAGFDVAVGFSPFESSPRALGQDDVDGFIRLLSDQETGELLGGELVGRDAGELIHMLSLVTDRKAIVRHLTHASFNHPARAEEFRNATGTMAMGWGLQERIFGEELSIALE
ncbi:dihydrolipoyl dehydrogenase family protein [Acidithiobacillus ferrivorans]|nr:NAD(P)/FAD-dependent oxidoreductase [Acidithiobacillus ferrivorans]